MKGKRALAAFVAALVSVQALPEDKLEDSDKEFITTAVNVLSDCSGFYAFMADIFGKDKPATSEQMLATARGAQMAAAYLLSVEYAATHGKQKQVGAFTVYVDGRAEVNKNRMLALIEQEDAEGVKAEQQRCLEAMPMQDELVQQLRNRAVSR